MKDLLIRRGHLALGDMVNRPNRLTVSIEYVAIRPFYAVRVVTQEARLGLQVVLKTNLAKR